MMDETLRTILMTALGATPVDWGMSAQGITPPRVVLWRISGAPDYTNSGPSGLEEARVQMDCYAISVGGAKLLARQVKTALSGLRQGIIKGAFLDAERDLPPDTDGGSLLARVSLDFNIHYQG
jgi:hypothetical protein